MVDIQTFRRLALSHPDVEELPHFEKTSFRWRNKIFATLREGDGLAMVQLSLTDQDVFCSFDNGSVFYPVPNAWGKKGSTYVNLNAVRPDMLTDAISCAYQTLMDNQLKRKK